jgi:hypothetical protein
VRLQSRCLIRIGACEVRGVWRGGHAGERFAETPFRSDEEAPLGSSLKAAIAALLEKIAPRRRLFAPRVIVGLAAPHGRAAIMSFAKLPKDDKDRDLLVVQRFCREYRIDPASVNVRASPLGALVDGGESMLCCAVPRALLAEIAASLAERGLHADLIAPDYLLAFAEADGDKLEAPGIALWQWSGAQTILVWNKERKTVHIAFSAAEPGDAEASRRAAARINRYASIVAEAKAPVALYADGPLGKEGSRAEAAGSVRLKLMTWPSVAGDWSRLGRGSPS